MNKEFTQEELKELFLKPMSDDEKLKIDQLGMSDKILKLNTPTFQVKYFDNIGYTFIGDGYLIMSNGLEKQHYFCTIIDSEDAAKQHILNMLNETNDSNVVEDNKISNIPVPEQLKDFISFDEDGYAFANQKLPIELENDYNSFINNYYTNSDNKVVNTIVSKIVKLSFNDETTIAQLINYKPEEAFVSPMTQGIIRTSVLKQCENKGIRLEENRDEIGGLPYFVKFKKIN